MKFRLIRLVCYSPTNRHEWEEDLSDALRKSAPTVALHRSSLGNEKRLVEISDEVALTLFQNFVAFGFQAFFQTRDSPGIFFIQLPAGFQRAPVRSDFLPAIGGGFFRGVRSNPGEDAGGHRTTEVRAMLPGKSGANFIDRDEPAFRDLL